MGRMEDNLRYDWIAYIPPIVEQGGFFADVREEILGAVRGADILEDWEGGHAKPEALTIVPALYRDDEGVPFALTETNRGRFLYSGYSEAHVDRLDALGVVTMGVAEFVRALEEIPLPRRAAFVSRRSPQWHAALARVMLMSEMPVRHQSVLPLIPTRDGRWVSRGFKVYFSHAQFGPSVPEGIKVDVVDEAAAADGDRAALFRSMGVREISERFVREAIANTHRSPAFDRVHLEPGVMASHVEFFWSTRPDKSADDGEHTLWMVSETGSRHLGDKMYLRSDAPWSAFVLLRQAGVDGELFLHPAYTAAKKSQEHWKDWERYMQKSMKVNLYPRLCHFTHAEAGRLARGCTVHDDFATVMREHPGNAWLSLLRDGWDFYSQWLLAGNKDVTIQERAHLREYLGSQSVRVLGSSEPAVLSSTYIPRSSLTGEYGYIAPYVDIPDPDDPMWELVLGCLGVGSEADVKFHLACLNCAKINEKVPLEEIRSIMHRVEAEMEGPGDDKRLQVVR